MEEVDQSKTYCNGNGAPRHRPAVFGGRDFATPRHCGADSLTRPATIPAGCWPRRMCAELAAGYCGEATVEAFIARVGHDYPEPRVVEGRRRLWLRDDLDAAILPPELAPTRDVAEDL
jgi:hypothetical protein